MARMRKTRGRLSTRLVLSALLAITLACSPALAGEAEEQAADQVTAALESRDFDRLNEIAVGESPDAADVAAVLIARDRRDDAGNLMQALLGLGIGLQSPGNEERALRAFAQALSVAQQLGVQRAQIVTRFNRANYLQQLGRSDEALVDLVEARKIAKEHNPELVAQILGLEGECHISLLDHVAAERVLREAETLHEEAGNVPSVARARDRLANVYEYSGRYDEALAEARSALEIAESTGDPMLMSRVLNSLGMILDSLARFAEAIRVYERAQQLNADMDFAVGQLIVLGNLGAVYMNLDDPERATDVYREALALAEEQGNPYFLHAARVNLANAYDEVGAAEEALQMYEAAQAALGDGASPRDQLKLAGNIGLALGSLGRHEEAVERMRESVELAKSIGDLNAAALNTLNIGSQLELLGRLDEARATFQAGLDLYTEIARDDGRARALVGLATLDADAGRLESAQAGLMEAIEITRTTLGGLSDQESVRARDAWRHLIDVGISVAAKRGDAAGVLRFMEQGRAVALLDALGGAESVGRNLLPPELVAAEADARNVVAVAEARLAEAVRGRVLADIRAARAELETAKSGLREVLGTIQRDQRTASDVIRPEIDDLATIQGRIEPSTALVLFALNETHGTAVVVRSNGARIVRLESADVIDSALDGLLLDEAPYIDPAAAEAVQELLIEPLGLGPDVTRVLVSPDGRIGFAPFSLLLPGRDLAYLPSGSIHGLALEMQRSDGGRAVLALGDPNYGADAAPGKSRSSRFSKLLPLPQTRIEVEAVGTKRLLGDDASPTGLKQALAEEEHWRAVHFACHGLIDPKAPLFSALALSQAEGDDGLLLSLDILTMDMPTDLVVLSACQTGRGTIYRSEGIVGLTRSFMVAGAPRVLCSLWNVDDEATRALMVKFYELWNPRPAEGETEAPKGLPPAEALRRAQEHVRSQEKWRHPRFWAAWVLWGLPD